MALTSWLCTNNTKNMVVKIVHPGGRIELHDRPMLAAEIMQRNPRCCVAYPHVFREPWAIMAPDGVLALGQKYYVVPMSTIRKLQRLHSRRSSSSPPSLSLSPLRRVPTSQTPRRSLKKTDDDANGSSTGNSASSTSTKEIEKQRSLLEDGCLKCLLRGPKPKAEEGPIQSSRDESSESKELNKKRASGNEKMGTQGSPKRQMKDAEVTTVSDHWQPRLESIYEEHPF